MVGISVVEADVCVYKNNRRDQDTRKKRSGFLVLVL